MKKPLIFVVIICLVGLVWFVFQNNRVITPASNSSSLEVNTSQVVDIKKYFNQPITLVKEDWPLAENTVDKKRSIF